MKSPLVSIWRPTLLIWMGLLLHCAEAGVFTEIQTGPLYRVVGSKLSISCNVSGFNNEMSQKSFEFRVKKPARSFEINVISTNKEDFSYSIYQSRVDKKDISLKHVNPNSALFEIQHLLKDDEGEYECTVENTEETYDGTYTAKAVVNVIDNSLSISSSDAAVSLSYYEGEALTLTCQASSNTIQHTHLSFTWYLHKDGEGDAQPIISLDRDFTLIPGQEFEQRYRDGAISLDKLGEATYRLKMAQLELSDQGKIFCEAHEWIQDPDRSWHMITKKDAEKTTLTVKAREVSDMSSLVVRITSKQTDLQEGEELLLSCSIDTQNLEGRFFSVAWLWNGIEQSRIGPTGILTVKPEYSDRAREGELRTTRTGNRNYQLILKPARTSDQGKYVCRAWPEDRGNDGFTQGAAQDSDPVLVKISAAESELSVTMQNAQPNITQRNKLRLVCKVGGFEGQLSVTWKRKLTVKQTAPFTSFISLSQAGVMETVADFTSRKVRVTRPSTDSFVLELDEVVPSDSGVYQCAVTEWKSNGKTHSLEESTSVTVIPVDSLLQVSLKSRNSRVTVGDDVELMCQVKGPSIPLNLIWSKQNDNSALSNIVSLSSDGSISWSGDQYHYQAKVDTKQSPVTYYLKIIGASIREAGIYQCSVSVFLENVYKKLPPSNQLRVMVQNPVSKLVLSSKPFISQNINTAIQISCAVTSDSSHSSLYAVTWLHQQEAANKTILSSDRKAVEAFGPQAEQSYRQRISMSRTKGPTFELTIQQARISDGGSYICEVVEWLQDPRGDWYSLAAKSVITKLNIIEPANDLTVDEKEQQLMVKEGNEVKLDCNITSGAPAFFYKVTWFYAPPSSMSLNASLVELDQTGLLVYPKNQALSDLQGRLHLTRPSQKNFYLTIQRAHESDSGIYWCQAEQYQLDNEGQWKQKASKNSGPINLVVNVADTKLSIEKKEVEMNISAAEGFTIPCHITQQSSDEAQFQVTWFWQKDAETKQHPIFTAYRNSTFHTSFEKTAVRFSHPLPRHFTLTVLEPDHENSGLYFCEVEEWLHSLTRGWRRAAVEKSGNVNVTVQTGGRVKSLSQSDCMSSIWVVTLVVVIIICILVILILGMMICRSKASGGNKSNSSYWPESNPLNDKTTEF